MLDGSCSAIPSAGGLRRSPVDQPGRQRRPQIDDDNLADLTAAGCTICPYAPVSRGSWTGIRTRRRILATSAMSLRRRVCPYPDSQPDELELTTYPTPTATRRAARATCRPATMSSRWLLEHERD